MIINKNSTEQINVALLDLENKIKRNNQTSAISSLSNEIELINKTLKEKQNGLKPGETYNINISGNASTSDHSLTADSATTAESANTATSAGHSNTSDYADYATSAGSAPAVFPEGFVYIQLNGKSSPADMNMLVPDGCAWVDISAEYASFPYIKIGPGTTQSGHNAYHTHSFNHAHKHSHVAYRGCYPTSNEAAGYGLGGQPGFQNRVMVSATSNVGTSEDATGPYIWDGSKWTPRDYTSYNGNSAEQTVEVNATYAIAWEVKRI